MSFNRAILHIKLLLIICSLFAITLQAQDVRGGYAGSYARMGFSPRGIATANAMTSYTGGGSYAYYNPALTAIRSDSVQVDVATSALSFDRSLNMLHAHFQLPPSAGFSVSLLHARVGNIDGRDLNGYHTGTLSTQEFQLIGNFAIRFSKFLYGGIGIKYNYARLHADVPSSKSIGLDAGLLIRLSSRLHAGFSLRDLFSGYRLNTAELYGSESSSDRTDLFPLRLTSGISYLYSKQISLSLDVEQRWQSYQKRVISELGNVSRRSDARSSSRHLRLGGRYRIHEWVTLRSGIELTGLDSDEGHLQPAAGFSLHLPFEPLSPSIDYGFAREPSHLSTMHIFGIRLNI